MTETTRVSIAFDKTGELKIRWLRQPCSALAPRLIHRIACRTDFLGTTRQIENQSRLTPVGQIRLDGFTRQLVRKRQIEASITLEC
ncbi:hypothetical protein ACKC9G_00230 [Pokkaliibacter sp. CJK22405]|uniref:hypothetical protein n=1 Tax=Pokkaliibacter sp. CJK22405 TaxID=3384615 RepID=UPI003984832B